MSEINKKRKNILSVLKKANPPTLDEAKPFTIPVEVTPKNLIIKLPRKALNYLKINKGQEISVIPINGTIQIATGQLLTGIPAIDLAKVEDIFAAQPN